MKFTPVTLFIACLFYTMHGHTTPQIPDSMTYNGQDGVVVESPFESLRKEKKLEFKRSATANYRGYLCAWKIEDDSLYLVSMSGTLEGSEDDSKTIFPKLNLKEIFPDASGDVPADWFTGTLYFHSGKLKLDTGVGIVRAHENLIVFDIAEGKVLSLTEYVYPDNIKPINTQASEKFGSKVDIVRENRYFEEEETFQEKAITAFRNKEYEKAIELFTEALKIMPGDPMLYLQRGCCYDNIKAVDKALKDLTEAIEKEIACTGDENAPELAGYYYVRGEIHENAGGYGKAIADFEKALSIKPDHPMVSMILPWLLATCSDAALRNPARAVELAKIECERKEWQDPDALDTLAAAYAASEDFPKALEMQKRALKLAKTESARKEFEERLKLYEAGKPFYQKSKEQVKE